jgi:hypothetical protein
VLQQQAEIDVSFSAGWLKRRLMKLFLRILQRLLLMLNSVSSVF